MRIALLALALSLPAQPFSLFHRKHRKPKTTQALFHAVNVGGCFTMVVGQWGWPQVARCK